MVALGEDLRAHEDVGTRGALQQIFEPAPRARRVAIHAQDARVGKLFRERNLDTLRPASECLQIGVAAFRTGARNAFGQSAMVTTQPLSGQMHDHARRTTPAPLDPAAGGAGERWRIATAIEENERLLPTRKARGERFEKRRDNALLGWMHPCVDQAYRRQCRPVDGASREGYQLVFARGRVLEAFERRRSRAQNDRRARDLGPRDCEVARRIAHAVPLLERSVLLFIDHDQSQAGERREYGEPRAEHDIGATAGGEEPSAGAFPLRHGGGLRDDACARESVAEGGLEGGSERYLGYENQDLSASGEDLGNQVEIDFCLATAGDTKEQAYPKRLQPASQDADSVMLLRSQFVRVDKTRLGPLRLDGGDPNRFDTAPQQGSAPPCLCVELRRGYPTVCKPPQQRAQAPLTRRSCGKHIPSGRRKDVVAQRDGYGLGGAQSRGQGRRDYFTERGVVVVTAEIHQVKPVVQNQ